MKACFTRLALLLMLTAVSANAQQARVDGKIDWPTFLSRHDLVWEIFSSRFDHGAFLGNGLLGTTIYTDGPDRLRFEIGRSDVTDHRRDNARLPIGGMILKISGTITSGTLRTDLWNAEMRGEMVTDQGRIRFRAMNNAAEIALLVDLETEGGEKDAAFLWEPTKVWPLHQISLEQPENRALVEKSLKHWLTVENGKQFFGWSSAAASCLYSCMGDGGNALAQLRAHHNNKKFVMPNTQYIEGSPVIECSLVAATALQSMLLQSWGESIRIFLAMPPEWKEAVFHDLRAEGAFLVSAGRKDGKTRWVRIKSLAGEPCKVRPGFDGALTISLPTLPMKELEPGLFELGLLKGQEVILFQDADDIQPEVTACELPQGSANFWGIKNR